MHEFLCHRGLFSTVKSRSINIWIHTIFCVGITALFICGSLLTMDQLIRQLAVRLYLILATSKQVKGLDM